MENTFLSYNVASSSCLAGLNQLIALLNPLFIFLQENILNSEQLVAQVGSQFKGASNIDENETRKPGNAVLWRVGVEVVVTNVVERRIQLIQTTKYGNFINVYAPTGNQGESARRTLFSQHLLSLTLSTSSSPILVGDWNCLIRKQDKEGWNASPDSVKLSTELKQLIQYGSYTDAFLYNNSGRIGYTWRRRGRKASRLDRAYILSSRQS